MNTKHMTLILIGVALFAGGVVFVGFDFGHFKRDVAGLHMEGALADDHGHGRRPRPYSEDELRSELMRAEEYLRQNSRESAEKAQEIYNSILSYDSDAAVNAVARFGLASALYRLGDDRRALEHLRQLKKAGVKDVALAENVDYLMGRILMLMGHEDEGRAILNALLSRTTDRVIQSRVHATFGDYYAARGDRARARRSYRIAVEYYPDNLHAAFSGESARRFAGMGQSDRDAYDSRMSDRLLDERDDAGERKRPARRKRASRESERSHASVPYDLRQAEEAYGKGLALARKGSHLEAVKVLLGAEQSLDGLLRTSLKDPDLKARVLNLEEKTLYRVAESYTALQDRHLAHTYFDRVLANPDPSLDQAALVRKGILFFDVQDYDSAYLNFNKAVHDYPDGSFSRRAEEWLRETENLMKARQPVQQPGQQQ